MRTNLRKRIRFVRQRLCDFAAQMIIALLFVAGMTYKSAGKFISMGE